MKFWIKTYGCQMNVRDAESVGALLQRHGLTSCASEDEADVVIVNTCSVREKAEDKAVGKLRLLSAPRRRRRGVLVGAMGCMVQRLGAAIFDAVPGLDFAVGTQRLARIPAIVDLVAAGRGPVLEAGDGEADAEALAGHADGGASAFVNILFGCDRRCAYCVVPAVRGAEWSRPAARVLAEVRGLAAHGVKEVTLLGQSVMAYGQKNAVWPADYASPCGFAEPLPRLLEAVSAVEGIRRVRFTSGHPSGCTAELARAMAELPPVCEHLHLPVQSGSDRVLKRMRRGYTTDGYRRAAERLRAARPGFAITTDVIVGFPGETLEDFEATRGFMQEIAFDNAFIFKYSPRPNTPAFRWDDDVPADEKARRNRVLLEDQDRTCLRINRGYVGRVEEVLVEGPSLRNEAAWAGRTRTNKIVIFAPVEGVQAGDLTPVRLERARPQTLYGSVA